MLINSFCATIANLNYNLNSNNQTNLNDIIKQTQERINNDNNNTSNICDENYIPPRCQIVFKLFDNQLNQAK